MAARSLSGATASLRRNFFGAGWLSWVAAADPASKHGRLRPSLRRGVSHSSGSTGAEAPRTREERGNHTMARRRQTWTPEPAHAGAITSSGQGKRHNDSENSINTRGKSGKSHGNDGNEVYDIFSVHPLARLSASKHEAFGLSCLRTRNTARKFVVSVDVRSSGQRVLDEAANLRHVHAVPDQ